MSTGLLRDFTSKKKKSFKGPGLYNVKVQEWVSVKKKSSRMSTILKFILLNYFLK